MPPAPEIVGCTFQSPTLANAWAHKLQKNVKHKETISTEMSWRGSRGTQVGISKGCCRVRAHLPHLGGSSDSSLD